MAVQVSYPGVYVEEFAPGAPIPGVGTNTAAFVGVASRGPINVPTKLTNWDQFKASYGEFPVSGFFLWYAVKGFFENGGNACYVVRASNGAPGEAQIFNRAGLEMGLLCSREPGGTAFDVTFTDAPLVDAASVYKPEGAIASTAGTTVTLTAANDAGNFRPGDEVLVGGVERATIQRVSGAEIRVSALSGTYTIGQNIVLADAQPGARTIRIASPTDLGSGRLVTGTVLTLDPAGASEAHVVESVQTEYLPLGKKTYRVTFRDGLRKSLSLGDLLLTTSIRSEEFNVSVAGGSVYTALSADAAHPNYWVKSINDDAGGSITIKLDDPLPSTELPKSLPETKDGASANTLAVGEGDAEILALLNDAVFATAIAALESIDDVNLLAVPDSTTEIVQQTMIQHCERAADRFAIIDAPPGLTVFGAGSVEEHRAKLDSTRGYAAFYYPWLRVAPFGSGDPILVPPSGHVCGILARSDSKRGVHKAPANEIVNGSVGVERRLGDGEHGPLNLKGVNVIRVFAGGRPMLWGARTTATDTSWQYVNVRRLFLFIEESIQEGIKWAVFEPNNLSLWKKLQRTIGEFLTRVWRDGGLFGAKPEEAFYVRIDESNNPFSEQALGRLNIELGVRPTYPAEFIILRIGIWPGGSAVSET